MNEKKLYDEIPLDELLLPFKKNWKIIAAGTFLFAVAGFVCAVLTPKTYEAKTYLAIGQVASKPLESIGQTKVLMTTPPTVKGMLATLGLAPTEANIWNFVSKVKYGEETGLLKISAEGKSPEEALQLVKIVSATIIRRHTDKYKDVQVELQSLLRSIKENIRPIPLTTAISDLRAVPTVMIVEPYANMSPVRPQKGKMVVSFTLSGLIISAIAAYFVKPRGD